MFRFHRIDLSPQTEGDYRDGSAVWLGQETRWLANIPHVFRMLSAPEGTHTFIAAPARGQTATDSATAYWGSLLFLLAYSFRWSSPGAGLAWWVQNNRPTDDNRLKLIEQTWVADGQFDRFCAWVWANPNGFDNSGMENWGPHPPHGRSEQWIAETYREAQRSGIPGPEHDDFLHLMAHISMSNWQPRGQCRLFMDNSGGPQGVLIAEDLGSWLTFLNESDKLASDHPSGRSWQIEVVVTTVGSLGTYRRSRETGRWFAGPHRLHMVGQLP